MKFIRIAGLYIFIASVVLFSATLFMGNYSLTETSIEQTFSDKKARVTETFAKVAKENGVLDKTYSNPFSFMSDVKGLFEKHNQQVSKDIAKEKGISSEETEKLIAAATKNGNVVYTKEVVDQVLSGEKAKTLDQSTNWMYSPGKTYDSVETFQNDLTNKVNDANRNLAKEFFLYDNKYSRFDITKAASSGIIVENKGLFLFLTFGLGIIGSLMFIITGLFLKPIPGIKNNGIYLNNATNRGWVGIVVFGFLVIFYVLLYFHPYVIVNWTSIVDPVKALFIENGSASQWFVYGLLYTVSMTVMAIRMFIKYRHNQYQIVRTAVVLAFQIIFAFLLVEILPLFDLPGVDLKNAWPLDYNFLTDWNVKNYLEAGHLGKFMFFWGIILSLILVPVLVYFYGKRWYCSWVCGCGGLAETLGDPYRQLSDKRLIAWKIERWTIYPVLVFAVIMTIIVGYNTYYVINAPDIAAANQNEFFGINAYRINEWYGFLIGSIFAGVIGTGFYPLLGNRTWCRFGCPLAAYMGIIQRFKSKFRITTNGGQCISCGNCSTYCEQGIDVRAYAQKGQNIVRSSCVGCGICSAVCPRGVLKLENASDDGATRHKVPEVILGNDMDLFEMLEENK
ncbi:4Fe-4S dicluster domain-containing protein [Kordia algicida OT-1]|uniref:Pyridine nucleotide-disulphide oxidoreductase domain protein n=1 Tax=Kordia algicida OT-1 TaxID=391587 RepID=A9DKQ1_9FLAO|nr:4Fe-4S dicluster domain-containing protein [Kordia algicida]EDP98374.1 Pyridine nucleotide-disulphide oxidoreductase domain protein [Kordia algicida OT-1]